MIAVHRRARLATLALTALIVAGCNDGSVSVSSSSTEAPVRGKVVIKGKPAADGFVVFDPANVKRRDATIRRAKIEKDGTYSVTTLIGENRVSVEGPEITKGGLEIAGRRTIDVAGGENIVDLEVPPNGAAGAKKGPH